MSTAEEQPPKPVISGDVMPPGLLAKAMGMTPFPDDLPAFERLQTALFEGDKVPCVFFVINEHHITPYVYLSEEKAVEVASMLGGGVVAAVPIVFDFRKLDTT